MRILKLTHWITIFAYKRNKCFIYQLRNDATRYIVNENSEFLEIIYNVRCDRCKLFFQLQCSRAIKAFWQNSIKKLVIQR